MSRLVKMGAGKPVLLEDDEAEAWELANKIINDLKDKYNLDEPKGVDALRGWLDEAAKSSAYYAAYPPLTLSTIAEAKAVLKEPRTVSILEIPYVGSGSRFTATEARTYLPPGATLVGVDNDMRSRKYIITYSV